MLNRRAGTKYIKAIVSFENAIRKLKIINMFQCTKNIVTRMVVAGIPNKLRKLIYDEILREKDIHKNKNIAFTINSIKNGGPSNVILNIIKEMNNSEYTPFLITFFDENDENIIKKLDIKVINLKYKSRIQALIKGRKKVNKIIKEEKIDIIHSNGFIPDVISAKLKKVKRVSTVHCNFKEDYKNTYGNIKGKIYEKINIWALRKLDLTIGCSKNVYEYLKEKVKLSTFVRNGVSTDEISNNSITRQELNIPIDAIVFIYTGVISKGKQVFELIKNFEDIHKKNDYLIILGDGEEKEACENIAKENVVFCGFVKDVKKYLKISNFYVSNSSSEGMSISIIEAIEEGLPVLLSNIPSHRELFEIDSKYYIGEIFDENFKSKYEIIKNKNKENSNIKEFQKKYLSSQAMAKKYFEIYKEV